MLVCLCGVSLLFGVCCVFCCFFGLSALPAVCVCICLLLFGSVVVFCVLEYVFVGFVSGVGVVCFGNRFFCGVRLVRVRVWLMCCVCVLLCCCVLLLYCCVCAVAVLWLCRVVCLFFLLADVFACV